MVGKLFSLVVLSILTVVAAENDRENVTRVVLKKDESVGRGNGGSVYRGLLVCALKYDAGCFLDLAGGFLDSKKVELLAQADREVARASGGSVSPPIKPSQVADTIEKLFRDLAGLFKDGFTSLFNPKDEEEDEEGKEGENKDLDQEEEENGTDTNSRDVGAGRKYKKKKKKNGPLKRLFRLIKIIILTAIVFLKTTLLVNIFAAALKLKLVLLGAGFLVLFVLKIWLDEKNRRNQQHQDHVGVVYKHPSDSGVEWSGPGAEYQARNLDFAQKLAYNHYLR